METDPGSCKDRFTGTAKNRLRWLTEIERNLKIKYSSLSNSRVNTSYRRIFVYNISSTSPLFSCLSIICNSNKYARSRLHAIVPRVRRTILTAHALFAKEDYIFSSLRAAASLFSPVLLPSAPLSPHLLFGIFFTVFLKEKVSLLREKTFFLWTPKNKQNVFQKISYIKTNET